MRLNLHVRHDWSGRKNALSRRWGESVSRNMGESVSRSMGESVSRCSGRSDSLSS